MIEILNWLLPVLGGMSLAAAGLNLINVIESRRFARRRRDQLPTDLPPELKAVVVVPCRGAGPGFRRHCQALLEQEHPNFEVLFVVENEQDTAVRVIRNLMQEHRLTRIGLIFSGPAEHCSQKVHQLRTALRHLPGNARVVAFLDSDLLVRRQWLRWLCGRLYDSGVAAVTGAVWSVPRKESFYSNLQCSISNSLASWFGAKYAPGLWGSWAVRVDRLEAVGLPQVWATAFSERWSAQQALCLNGERVVFEPRSVGVRQVETDSRGLRRTLVRWWRSFQGSKPLVSRWVWVASVALQLGFWGLLVGGLGSLAGADGIRWGWLAGAVLIYCLNVMAGIVRGQLGKQYAEDSRFNRIARRWDCWAWPINAAVMIAADVGARWQSRVRWSDLVYRVDRSGRVALIGRKRLQPLSDEVEFERDERSWGVIRSVEGAPPHGAAVPEPVVRRKAG
ncbi:MAG: glycosyltransferase [Planctomycetota bacterium]